MSVEPLRRRHDEQEGERQHSPVEWPEHTYDGERLSMVFTTSGGQLSARQTVLQTIDRAAKAVGIDPTGLGTHAGRRTVITALYADGGVDLADIARHVGHSDTSTTAEYVKRLGNRPVDPARRAAELLDPTIKLTRVAPHQLLAARHRSRSTLARQPERRASTSGRANPWENARWPSSTS